MSNLNTDIADAYADSKTFEWDCEDVAAEWLHNNHKFAQAWWEENSFEYSPAEVLHTDFLDRMAKDFLAAYETQIVDEVWVRHYERYE